MYVCVDVNVQSAAGWQHSVPVSSFCHTKCLGLFYYGANSQVNFVGNQLNERCMAWLSFICVTSCLTEGSCKRRLIQVIQLIHIKYLLDITWAKTISDGGCSTQFWYFNFRNGNKSYLLTHLSHPSALSHAHTCIVAGSAKAINMTEIA